MNKPNVTVDRSSLSSRRSSAIPKLAVSIAMLLIGAPIAACSAASGPGPNPNNPSECSSDDDCSGTEVCKAGSCVASSKHDAGAPDSAADSAPDPTPDASPPMTCTQTGHSCSTNGACCNFQAGTGFCTNFGSGGECADSCTTNSDCSSGCCAATQGGGSVCGPSSACTTPPPSCHNPGLSCTVTGDCCQSGTTVGPYGATCLSDDYECHAKCYASSECGSGCCVKLNGVAYGACGTSTGHTCL